MKRWWLWIVLLLSLGVNVGILLTLATGWGEGRATVPSAGPEEGAPGRIPRRSGGGPPGGPPGALPPGLREGSREPRILGDLADRLGLQGEVRDHFLSLQRGFFVRAFESRQQGFRLQEELGRELTAPEPDRERVSRLIDELADTRRALDHELAETVLATRDLLDDRQERDYLVFIRRLRERMDRPGGPGPSRWRRPETRLRPR